MVRALREESIIVKLGTRCNYTVSDICRNLSMTDKTFWKKINRAEHFTVGELMKISGMLGVRCDVLFYLVTHYRNEFKIAKEIEKGKKDSTHVWYMDTVHREAEVIVSSFRK